MDQAIRVGLTSPPDRDNLVAEIMVGDEQLAEVNQESDRLTLEIYPRRDGQPWVVEFDLAMQALVEAKNRLGTKPD